jgi:hypothetical protein
VDGNIDFGINFIIKNSIKLPPKMFFGREK